jgi:competence protein ComEC
LAICALRWRVFALLTLCLLTTTWSVWCAQQALALQPPSTIEEKPFKVQVQIEGLPEYTPYGLRFRVKPLKVVSRINYPISTQMRWQLTTPLKLDLRPQQIWQITVSLRRPHGISSAGAFDYQAWLLSEGISATGKVTRAQRVSLCFLEYR